MNANSNSTDTLSSSKMNLSFFKKRITPKITQNFHKNSPIEEPKIFSTSRKTIEKQISKDIEERINILEKEFNNENITISQIKELLELCAEAVEYYESINDDRYLNFKQKMLFVLNKSNVKQALNRNNEKTKNQTNPIVESLKFTKKKTEEIFLIHEQSYLKKKDIINIALKTQMEDINVKLENRRFSKSNTHKITAKKHSLFLDMDIVNETNNHSNLSTKSEEIIENTNYSGSYTTREKSQSILINEQNKEIMVPLTCRGFSLNEISSDEEIVQNIKVSYHEKINEITAFYDEKIRIIEGRFFKNNEKKHQKESKLFVKLIEKLNEEKCHKLNMLQKDFIFNKN